MTDYSTEAAAVADAMNAVYENKQVNKKNDISGDFSSDNASYPTVKAVKAQYEGTGTAKNQHVHGNISHDGKIGSTSGKPVVTGTNGALTTGEFGTSSGQFAEGNHTHSNYLTSHQSLDSKTVTIEQQGTAESGMAATYVIKQGGTALSPKINIPKDFLL